MRDVARNLARANFAAFQPDDFDAIITNAAGCGSTLKEYTHLFSAGDRRTQRSRGEFSGKMRDVSEFLADARLIAPLRSVPLRVTYQDSCHWRTDRKSAKPRAN